MMEDDDEDIILQSHQMVPEKDLNGLQGGILGNLDMGGESGANYGGDIFGGGQLINAPNINHLATQAEAAFNQQRVVVARLSREELEDRYLRLLEENVVIKKHACKQEDKIKKLATKLIRVLSDKKRLEMTGGGSGVAGAASGGRRDIETEELIEDQQHKIRELERQNTHLKEKLMVAKQQLLAVTSGGRSGQNRRNIPRAVAHPMMHVRQQQPMGGNSSQIGVGSPSPVPMQMQGQLQPTPQLLSQQAHQLLEEAKNENRMLEDTVATLKEQVNIFEQEVEQIREQSKIKESNFEEEIAILKEQVKDRECQTVTENIEMIRLQQDKKSKTGQITTLKSQLQGLEETLAKLKGEEQSLRRENANLNDQLQEEQKKSITLTKEVSVNASSKQALLESEEKSRDLQRENAILRESNEKLLDAAYNVERERHFVASETALKVQVAQLESTLKADLSDKKTLTDALAKERESYAKLEAEYKDLQSRYFSLKETVEGQEEKLQFFAKENSVSSNELEEALLLLRNKQRTSFSQNKSDMPSFLDRINQEDLQSDVKTELSELQVRHVEAVNELEKTRSLLKAQAGINREQKNEVEALQNRLQQVKAEFQSQLSEYKKLLDMRAARIKKLELQLRETAYGQAQKLTERQLEKATTVHTPSGQSLFEIHMLKANLTKEILINLGSMEPKIFATWTFYDHSMQYTPVTAGPEAVFDCSAYYKIKLDDAFLDYLADTTVQVEVHLVVNKQDCKPIAQTELSLREVLDYPSNKLHGSVILTSLSKNTSSGNDKDQQKVIGTLDYWFKLHTAAVHRIRQWQEHKAEVEKVIETNLVKSEPFNEAMLLKEKGRKISTNQHAENMLCRQSGAAEEFNVSVEPHAAPRVKPIQSKPLERQERSKGIESTDQDSETSNLTKDKRREIPDSGGKPYTTKASFDKGKDSSSNKEKTTTGSGKGSIEDMDLKKGDVNSGKPIEKSTAISSHLSKSSKSMSEETNQTASSVDSTRSENSKKIKDQKKKHSPPPTQIKTPEAQNLASQEQNLESNCNSENSPNGKDTDNSENLEGKTSPPIPKPRTSPSRKATQPEAVKAQLSNKGEAVLNRNDNRSENRTKHMISENDVEVEKAEMTGTLTDKEETSGDSSVTEESSARDIDSKDEENEHSEGDDEDEVLDESDEGEEEESMEEESSKAEEACQSEENDDEENEDVEEYSDIDGENKEETQSHSTDQSEDESYEDSKHSATKNKKVKESVSHLVDVHQTPPQDSSTNETSQDSEGVVMLKSPSTTKKHSLSSKDKIAITIVEFKAVKGAKFLKNKNIDKLYVEYKFLDVPSEELETPSFPKPKVGGESFKFNFTKIISVDRAIHSKRRRKLVKMLTSEPSDDEAKDSSADCSMLIFTLVSEPPEDKKEQDCEDVGIAKIDLKMILSTGQDIVDLAVDLFSSEVQSRVSRLLNTGNKPIGTLTISIEASEVFKSLRLK